MSATNENPNALSLKDGTWKIKINKKSFFQKIATGLALFKMGSYSSAAKQGISALFEFLPEDNTSKRAYHLIFTAIHNACIAILREHGIEGTRFDLNTQAQNVELESKLQELDVILKPSFFDRPDKLDFIKELEKDFTDWTIQVTTNTPQKINKTKALKMAEDLGDYFQNELIYEWRKHKSYYGAIKDYFDHPWTQQIEKRATKITYYNKLKNEYLDPAFGDIDKTGMKLKDIYIEPYFRIYKRCLPDTVEILEETEDLNGTARDIFVHPKAQARKYTIHQFTQQFLDGTFALPLDCKKSKIMLLLGQPGQGKTSFCKRLVFDLIRAGYPKNKDCYLIKLRALRQVDDLIKDPLPKLKTFIEKKLKQTINSFNFSNALLILDGLDELYMKEGLSGSDIDEFCKELARLVKEEENLQIILTSRHNYVNLEKLKVNEFHILQLDGFTLKQQKDWLAAYQVFYPNIKLNGTKLGEINDGSKKNLTHIRELINQPILLQLIATANFDISEEANRAEIYDQLFTALSKRSHSKDGQLDILENITAEDLRYFIREVALEIYQSDFEYIRRHELEKLEFAKDFQKKLNITNPEKLQGALRSMMIAFYFQNVNKDENDDNQEDRSRYAFEFLHKSLQEYLVAEKIWLTFKSFLVKNPLTRNYIVPNWQEALKQIFPIFAPKSLNNSVRNYLIEIIKNDTETDKWTLSQQLANFLPDLIQKDFLLKYDLSEKHYPMDLATNTFYGYWLVLSHLIWDKEAIDDKDKNFIQDTFKERFCILLKNTQNITVRFFNLAYQNLVSANLESTNLGMANLVSANLEMANLVRANLEMASLINANLDRAILYNANLYNANLYNANMNSANLEMASLDRTILISANLDRANLDRASLVSANLEMASLISANLVCTNLTNANLEKVNLKRATLEWANLYNTTLESANLESAILERANLENAILANANLDNAILERAILTNANLTNANLVSANLVNANLYGANLESTNLYGANLYGTNLEKVNLVNTNLVSVTIDNIRIDKKDWIDELKAWKVEGIEAIIQQYQINPKPNKDYRDRLYYLLEKK